MTPRVHRSARSRRRAVALFALLLVAGGAADAATRLPYRSSLRAEIEAAFLAAPVPDGSEAVRLSFEKLRAYKTFVHQKRRFLGEHLLHHELAAGRDPDEALERIERKDVAIALDVILERLEELTAETDPARIFELAGEILTLEYATRSYTDPIGSIKIPVHLKNMAISWDAPARTRARGAKREAGNLVDPETGLFYTDAELRALVEAGFDLSLLDPPDETPFWRARPDVSAVNVRESYLAGADPVHEGLPVRFPQPDGAVVHFDKTHMTQSKPKIDVHYYDEECRARKKKKQRKKCRLKLKLKFGMETHADPVANSLIAALGYNADLTLHLKRLRVYLGDKSFDELQADWAGYFDRQRLHTYIPLHSVLLPGDEGHGFDERGREYVVFREAVAELKHDEIHRIGFFPFSHGIAEEHREARGLFAFNVWIANADMKDEENNKVALRRDAGGRYRAHLIQQDLGHALGLVLPEKPDALPWDLVERDPVSRLLGALRGRIELSYLDLQENGLEHTATYADIKWMVRRIGRLTREQIEDAVALGRWPGAIGALYVEKLVERRNQLVEAFGLADELPRLRADRHFTSSDGTVKDGKLVVRRYPDSSIDFGGHTGIILWPVLHFLEESVMAAIFAGVAAVDVLEPGPFSVSGSVDVSPALLVGFVRRVHLNPDPTARADQYLVEDSVSLGLRPGGGYVGHVEGNVLRKVTVVYPAANRHDALKARHPALPLLFPWSANRAVLPDRSVVYREERSGAGLRLKSSDATLVGPLGGDVASTAFRARRSVVDRREEPVLVWLDRPRFLESRLRLYLRAGIVEIPFVTADHGRGTIPGTLLAIDPGATPAGGSDPVERLIRTGDAAGLERLATGPAHTLATRFETSAAHLDLFFYRAFATGSAAATEDESGSADPTASGLRVERRRGTAWSFLDNGEAKSIAVRGRSAVPGDAGAGSGIEVEVRIDDLNTHSHELNDYYAMLAGLAPAGDLLAPGFDATAWEISGRVHGRWTRMHVHGRLTLRAGALDRLARIDEARYWARLAERLGLDAHALERFRGKLRDPQRALRRRLRHTEIGRRAFRPVQRSRRVLAHLRRARVAADPESRLGSLVAALAAAQFRTGPAYDPVVLATLLAEIDAEALAQRGELLLEARISKAFEDENNLPERRDLAGRRGRAAALETGGPPLLDLDGVALYRALDWARR